MNYKRSDPSSDQSSGFDSVPPLLPPNNSHPSLGQATKLLGTLLTEHCAPRQPQIAADDERLVSPQYDVPAPEDAQLGPDGGGTLPLRLLDNFLLFVVQPNGSGWAAAGLEQLHAGAPLHCAARAFLPAAHTRGAQMHPHLARCLRLLRVLEL